MEYAATHERFDAFNINRYNAEIASGLPSCVSSVLMFLVGHINYRDDHAYFPKGTVSGLTAQKIAKALNMGVSTVQGHLSALKRMKIIEGVIIKCQKTGRTLGVRYYFIGFSKWLLSGGFLPKKREDNADQGEPVREAGVGGSDISDPIKRTNNLNIILDDGNLNLEYSGSVKYTPVEEAIRDAKPLAQGKAADPVKVWADFKALNLKNGRTTTPLMWLRRFCEVYGRKRFKRAETTEKQDQTASPVAIEKPVFDGSNPFEKASERLFDRCPAAWKNWVKPLVAKRRGSEWLVLAPTGFHAKYVETTFGDALRGCMGPVKFGVSTS